MQQYFYIYSKNCWINEKLQPATLEISNGIISNIFFKNLPAGKTGKLSKANFNAGGNILMPGVIDAHVHINEPGRTDWEGFETATKAAAAGGTTTLVDMPLNSSPVTTSKLFFEKKIKAAEGKLRVNCGFYGGIVPDNIDQIEGLIQAGVLGIKAFLTHSGIDDFPNVTRADLEKGMAIISKYNIPLLVHCELDDSLSRSSREYKNDFFEKNPTSYQGWLNSRPKAWENKAIRLMIKLCRKFRCRVHIVHVSSAEALEDIFEAKKEGLPITAETCPHYLFFNAETIPDGDTRYKCAPPIREKANNDLLKNAIVDGLLDFLATDHSPAPPEIKELESGNLQKAWGGIAGLQFLLPAAWTALKDKISLEKFIPLLTENPAHFLGLEKRKGKFAVGCDADLTIWNPKESFTVLEKDIFHRHKITPYLHQNLFGVVKQTFVNGKLIFDQGQFSNPEKIGTSNKNMGKKILNK